MTADSALVDLEGPKRRRPAYRAMATATPASVILLVLTLVITGLQFAAQKRFVHYESE